MTTTASHPGEVLARELEARGVTPTELARQLRVPANRITQIIGGKRGITGDSALRLAHWFSNDPEFWMKLQARHDLDVAAAQTREEIKGLPTCGVVRSVREGPHRASQTGRRSAA